MNVSYKAHGMAFRVAAGIAFIIGLSACASLPSNVEDLARPEQRRALHGELVRDMLAEGHNHAALAHLQELQRQQGALNDDQRLLRAEAYYRIGEVNAALADYRELTQTKKSGQAWHGIGRIYTPTQLRQALQAFNEAVKQRPTDAAIRNDLGYALLVAGRATDACRHLYTAYELAPQQGRIVANLVLCEAVRGNHEAEERLLQVHDFSAVERERHRANVVKLRNESIRRQHELASASSEG